MGIKPILERQPDFPKEYLGYAQSAFFGGRTSAHIRKVAVPVVYTDFLSMYPTVNSLMNLWRFVTARTITIVEHCQSEIEAFLGGLTADKLFDPATWKELTAFSSESLLFRTGMFAESRQYSALLLKDWQVAVNYLYSKNDDPNDALWFSLPDVAASVLLTGKVPRIVDAFRIEAQGKLRGLSPTKLRGEVRVDPKTEDFFKVVIEQRKRLAKRTDISKDEKERLDKAIKVLANATSYGIYAEMHRQESDQKVQVTCHGIDKMPFAPWVAHPDTPGEYCFPPLASLITGAARALCYRCWSIPSQNSLGGTYAMEDTDSMAIVATEHGDQIRCAGGLAGRRRNRLNTLSWETVERISRKFSALNPYDRDDVPGSILKIEEDNRDPETNKQRQLYCFAISAKRYALFLRDEQGTPRLLHRGVNNKEDRWSEHGLGHLLNPTDPESEDRDWIAQAWLNMIRRALNLGTQDLKFGQRPGVGRITVSSPAVMRPPGRLNENKQYNDQIKPFNFLLTCHVKPLGHPLGQDPERFHLISPYESDARQWLKRKWIDQYSGDLFEITTEGHHATRRSACVKTYGDILSEYEYHPEAKCAGADGNACNRQTVGLMATASYPHRLPKVHRQGVQ